MLKFAIVSFVALGAVIIVSLVWTKFTSKAMPPVLQQVRNAVSKTQLGQQAESVMGVTDPNSEGGLPINVNTLVASAAGSLINSVGQSASQLVASQAATIILNQYNQLPSPAQQALQQAICKP